MRHVFGFLLVALLVAGTFVSGVQFGQDIETDQQTASVLSLFAAKAAPAQPTSLNQFWEVWQLLDEKFAAGTSTSFLTQEEKIQGAIDGLVDAYGDPYTVYLPPRDTAAFTDDISGEFSGVGMEVGLRDNLITIVAPLPETPAARSGLLPGDVVTAIDGQTTERMGLDEAVRLIRGPRGTTVTLTIYREGNLELEDIPVVRDNITIPTVKTEMIDGVFVVSLYSFNALAETKVREAVLEFVSSDAEKMILDLRGNPGGFLESAVGIADMFLPAGKVIVEESFVDDTQNETFRSRAPAVRDFTPDNLVVLVDGGSASASEILAGALRDHAVATIIGAQTFGKGSVQELIELDDGSSLKVTIARWLTPGGTSISDGGLNPDIVISRTPQQRLEEIDPQRDAALRFLSGEVVESETFAEELLSSTTSMQQQ